MTPVEPAVNVILIGLGAIGKGVVRHLYAFKDNSFSPLPLGITLHTVIDCVPEGKEREDKRNFLARYFQSAGLVFVGDETASIEQLQKIFSESKAEGRSTVVIECTGSMALARLFDFCLVNKVPVITPNKAFLAKNMHLLDAFMEAQVPLLFEAAVGGGMPTIKLLRDMFGSDRISLMAGILNGTTNYILSTMEKGSGFDEAIQKARERHLAEPFRGDWKVETDADLSGPDVYSKISLLARLAWGCTAGKGAADSKSHGLPASFIRRGDLRYAKEKLGYAIRFVGVARQVTNSACARSMDVFYSPVMLPAEHELCRIDGENNALLIASDFTGTCLCVGPGAGPSPTANAIVSDLLCILREQAMHPGSTCLAAGAAQRASNPELTINKFDDVEFGGYYLRFLVKDQPGLVGGIARVLGEAGIGIREVLQLDHSAEEIRELLKCAAPANPTVPRGDEWKCLPFAMIVERASVKKVMQAVKSTRDDLQQKGSLCVEPLIIPLLDIPRVNGWQKRGGLEDLEEWSIEAALSLQGDKFSVDLFPGRDNSTGNSRAEEILNAEEKQIKAKNACIKRIFLCGPNAIDESLKKIIKDHQGRGVDVRVVNIDSARKYLRRTEDGLLTDFSVYATQEVGIIELADEKSDGGMETKGRGYQVYGSAELDRYIKTFRTLWAFAETPNLT